MLATICLVTAAFIGLPTEDAGDGLALMYFQEQSNDVLWTANLDGSDRTQLLELSSNPWDIDIDVAAGKMYWTESYSVWRANLDGTDKERLGYGGASGLKGIAVVPEPSTVLLLSLGAAVTLNRHRLKSST